MLKTLCALVLFLAFAVPVHAPAYAQDLSSVDARMTRWRLWSGCVDELCLTTAPAADFGLEYTNRSGSQIRGLRGTLHLYDAFNTELGSFAITQGSIPTSGTVIRQYSVWIPSQSLVVDQVTYWFEVTNIVWSDGRRAP